MLNWISASSFMIHKSQKTVYVKDKGRPGSAYSLRISGRVWQEGSMKGVKINGQGRKQEARGSRDAHFTGVPFGTPIWDQP